MLLSEMKNHAKVKYFRICVEVECEECRKRFVVQLDKFLDGRDFCSLHCSTQFSSNRKKLFFETLDKSIPYRTHQTNEIIPETNNSSKE